MGERTKGFLGLFLLFGILLTFAGIAGISDRTTTYNEPIYISKELEIITESDGSKTVVGQLKNRTAQDVEIGLCKIRLSDNGNYYSMLDLKSITIPANGVYDIRSTHINRTFTNASISRCEIAGVEIDLKYSEDGKVFDYSSSNHKTSTWFLIGGVSLLLCSVAIVLNYYIKKKTIKY